MGKVFIKTYLTEIPLKEYRQDFQILDGCIAIVYKDIPEYVTKEISLDYLNLSSSIQVGDEELNINHFEEIIKYYEDYLEENSTIEDIKKGIEFFLNIDHSVALNTEIGETKHSKKDCNVMFIITHIER